MARSALRDDLYAAHAALTRDVLASARAGLNGAGDATDRLAAWEDRNALAIGRAAGTLGEIWESERFTFTTMSVASRVIRTLVTSTTAASGIPAIA
jgi:glutamate dehydrogenase